MSLPEISAEQMRFAEEYAKDKNGVRAALAAGLSTEYFKAANQASYLLKKPEIRAWVRHLLRKQARLLKFNPEKIIRNWVLASQADPTCYIVGSDGKLDTAPGVPKAYLRAVRKTKLTRTERLSDDNGLAVEVKAELELRDPFGPEKALMEHFGEIATETSGADEAIEFAATVRALHGADSESERPGGPAEPLEREPGAAGEGVPEPGG